MARGEDFKIGEIARMLDDRVDSLARELLREGIKDGRHFVAGSVGGERGQSLKVNLSGPRRGQWTDFSAAKGTAEYSGDMLALVAVVHFGGKSKEQMHKAVQWAKGWLGLGAAIAPDAMAAIRREADARAKASAEAEARETEQKRRWATRLWADAVPIKGTPAQAYLAGRGIDFDQLGRVPRALRFHPAVWCPVRRGKYPALVACIMGPDGLRGVHRTYLDVGAGKGGPVKGIKVAPGLDQGMIIAGPATPKAKSHKLTIGPYQGGCIPLWKGACRKPLKDIAPGTAVYVSEGIEDGLSVALADPRLRVVAAVAIANMGGLELPPQVGPLVFIGQNDPLASTAVRALEAAMKRQQEAGREVRAMFPPEGVKDFNDLLMGRGA